MSLPEVRRGGRRGYRDGCGSWDLEWRDLYNSNDRNPSPPSSLEVWPSCSEYPWAVSRVPPGRYLESRLGGISSPGCHRNPRGSPGDFLIVIHGLPTSRKPQLAPAPSQLRRLSGRTPGNKGTSKHSSRFRLPPVISKYLKSTVSKSPNNFKNQHLTPAAGVFILKLCHFPPGVGGPSH
jgi:hypothetical protein